MKIKTKNTKQKQSAKPLVMQKTEKDFVKNQCTCIYNHASFASLKTVKNEDNKYFRVSHNNDYNSIQIVFD